jgi:hypothetical protein
MNWIIGGILAFLILRFLWRGYVHPSNVMTRQAANMNWVAVGRTDNPNGGMDVLLGRGGLVSKIDWQTGEVHLVKPAVDTPFEDYLALERWLTLKDKEIHDRAEAYQREVQAFSDMAKAQEKEFEEARKRGEDIEDVEFDPEIEQRYKFSQEVQERLRNGPAGDDLVDIDNSFKVSSPEYLKIFHELIKTAIEFGVSPTEVATILIMAFTTTQEEDRPEPVTSVVVYLRSSIKYLREHKGI